MTEERFALYGYDTCFYCARVKRALRQLPEDVQRAIEDRDVLREPAYRRELVRETGRATVPVLRIDRPDGSVEWMRESRDIVAYLRRRFGQDGDDGGGGPSGLRRWLPFGALLLALSAGGCGEDASPSAPPAEATETAARAEAPEEAAPTAAPEDRPHTWRHLVGHLPDELGELRADGEPRENEATVYGLPLASAERRYVKDQTAATLRLIDAQDVPALISGFATARNLDFDTPDDLSRSFEVNGYPATLQWSRDTGASHVTVLVGGRYLASVEVWPADGKEDAVPLIEALDVEALARQQ